MRTMHVVARRHHTVLLFVSVLWVFMISRSFAVNRAILPYNRRASLVGAALAGLLHGRVLARAFWMPNSGTSGVVRDGSTSSYNR